MSNLPNSALWHLQKSDGFMDLKMWDKAREELEAIAPEFHESIPYREALLRLTGEEESWEKAARLASELKKEEPSNVSTWIQLAYATRRSASISQARNILNEALEKFPEEPIIYFNLACYACQEGQLEEAMDRLMQAETLAPACRELALEDKDLEPLWPQLESDN